MSHSPPVHPPLSMSPSPIHCSTTLANLAYRASTTSFLFCFNFPDADTIHCKALDCSWSNMAYIKAARNGRQPNRIPQCMAMAEQRHWASTVAFVDRSEDTRKPPKLVPKVSQKFLFTGWMIDWLVDMYSRVGPSFVHLSSRNFADTVARSMSGISRYAFMSPALATPL